MSATTMTKTIVINLSDRRPVTIVEDAWAVIASVTKNSTTIRVREHEDRRRIVYGWAGHSGVRGGFLLPAVAGASDEGETIRAIRRVAGILGDANLGAECIAALPAERI